MISIGARTRFAYVIQLGKNFVDVVFPFKQAYIDNLCFNKIKPVPGSDDYNHHLRIYFKEDINEEVRMYMKMAFENGRWNTVTAHQAGLSDSAGWFLTNT